MKKLKYLGYSINLNSNGMYTVKDSNGKIQKTWWGSLTELKEFIKNNLALSNPSIPKNKWIKAKAIKIVRGKILIKK